LPSLALSILAYLTAFIGAGYAQTVTNLYSFTGTSAGNPAGALVQGRDGSFYSTTQGTPYGAIFELSPTGVETNLYAFDLTNGDDPASGLTLSSDGNFYGTSVGGGNTNQGVLFKVGPTGVYTVLHEFGGNADGAFPQAPPVLATDGNLYGTTSGTLFNSTVYKYTPGGSFSTIYQFDGAHGNDVAAALVQGPDGNLYGEAEFGGANNCGTLFKMSRSGAILNYFSLTCGAGGSEPVGPLVLSADGSFYGVASFAGSSNSGLIFKWTRNGIYSVLYQFSGTSDGKYPSGIMQAVDGNLYGATGAGGVTGNGVLFRLTTAGAYTLLYNFQTDIGRGPVTAPLQDTNGNFYGATASGGTYGFGGVYKLNMGLAPFITFVQSTGKAGRSAQILGQKLTGATSITFNGVPATSFTVLRDTYMTAVVPTGATTGPVVVTTPAGTFASNVNFRIQP
jgi:uncharacterized repeat protein (TIGR03803 family)